MISGVDTLAYSFEMDGILVWLTAKLLGQRTTALRLVGAAAIGVLPTLWVLLRQTLYAVPWELGLVWPALMLWAAFPRLARRFWLKSYLLFLIISLTAGGLLTAGLNWLHVWMPALPGLDWVLLGPPLLAAIGYGIPKYRVRQLVGRESLGEITLRMEGRSLTVPVLWDSGNQLSDPQSHRPVVILELASALEWLPEALFSWVTSLPRPGDPGRVPPEWQERVGFIPFRTLAGEGMMPVIAVEQGTGSYLDTWYAMAPLMVGLSRDKVSSDGSYVALATPKSLIRFPSERVGA